MERLHPGVYIEEVPSGVRPIEGVSTSTAAFLGKAQTGPVEGVVMVTDFLEFGSIYGGFLTDSFLAQAALQFFANGGRRVYIGRVANGAATANVTIGDRTSPPAKTLVISASSPGGWGNELEAVVSDGTLDPGDEFGLAIRRGGQLVEVFDNLSMDPEVVNFAEKVVNGSARLVRVAVDTTNPSTAVAGISTSGPSPATSLPADRREMAINVDADGPRTITLADPLSTGAEIATAIQEAVHALSPLRSSTAAAAYSNFAASFTTVYTLTSGTQGRHSAVQVSSATTGDAARLLKLGVFNGGSETTGAATLRPAKGTYLLGDGAVRGATLAVTLGNDGTPLQDSDYIQALSRLDDVRDVNIVAVPGIGTRAVVESGSAYCQNRMDCFFVADVPFGVDTKETAQTFVDNLTVKSSYAALYFPWLSIVDPSGASAQPLPAPPSGFVCGMYARVDAKRGVWKAPAGTEANVAGAVGLAQRISDGEQDTLNPRGVNVIRFFPSSGIVIWGARTLATRADPEYRYVPIRRLAIFLEQSIYNGIQWAVFEPNDEGLWSSLRLNIGAFMTTQFRGGAFQGDTPSKAFFVKCDSQTNPQDQIDAGIVTVFVGFAPLRPAEFVVIRISQKTAETG
jgi:phage tail sheath protein FI